MRQTKYTCDCCDASVLRDEHDGAPPGWALARVTLECFAPSWRNTRLTRELCGACQDRVHVTIKSVLETVEACKANAEFETNQAKETA